MPLYEYICNACRHEFEAIQKFSDAPLKKCPECGKLKVIKKVSLSAFTLKGEGWYKDGYSRPSEKPPEKSKTDSSKSTDTKTPATAGTAKDSSTSAAAPNPSTKVAKESTA